MGFLPLTIVGVLHRLLTVISVTDSVRGCEMFGVFSIFGSLDLSRFASFTNRNICDRLGTCACIFADSSVFFWYKYGLKSITYFAYNLIMLIND